VVLMQSTSASLLQRLREPDAHEAWDRFVELYTPLLYFWVCQTGLQAAEAGDVVQDVLVVLLQRLPEFGYERGRSFRNWLWTITKNKCRERARRESLRCGEPLGELTDAHQPEPGHELAEAEYRSLVVRQALQLMKRDFPEKTWKACWENVVEGRPAAEVAKELGVSVNLVYVAKFRVLHHLRHELAELLELD
jgi:RNA polymerase sigma-70 factor (ECF subfamily)